MNEEVVKEYLCSLQPKALGLVLNSLFSEYHWDACQNFALALVESENQSVRIILVAAPIDDDFFDDAPICQYGTCMNCQTAVGSWAKQVVCPVCGEDVFCS